MQQHLGLVITAGLFIAMGVRLLVVARLDPATLNVLINRADIVPILVRVMVHMLPHMLVALLLWLIVINRLARPKPLRWWIIGVLPILVAILVPWWLLALYGLVVAVTVFLLWWSDRRFVLPPLDSLPDAPDDLWSRIDFTHDLLKSIPEELWKDKLTEIEEDLRRGEKEVRRRFTLRTVGVWSVPWILAVFTGPIWLPAENVTLEDGEVVAAYVVASGEPGWLHLLTTEDRQVRTVRDVAVAKRELCDGVDLLVAIPHSTVSLPRLLIGAEDRPPLPTCVGVR